MFRDCFLSILGKRWQAGAMQAGVARLEYVAVGERVSAGPDAVKHVRHVLMVLLENEVKDVIPAWQALAVDAMKGCSSDSNDSRVSEQHTSIPEVICMVAGEAARLRAPRGNEI